MDKLRQRWEEKNMKEAEEKVTIKEMTIREASERYSVPKAQFLPHLYLLSYHVLT